MTKGRCDGHSTTHILPSPQEGPSDQEKTNNRLIIDEIAANWSCAYAVHGFTGVLEAQRICPSARERLMPKRMFEKLSPGWCK